MEMREREAVYLGAGEGRAVRVLGELVAYKTTATQTGGAYSLFEVEVPPEAGPPPHVQHQEDESFYVLEGEFEILSGDETTNAGPGSLAYIPKGTLHAYKNVGRTSGRLLAIQTPGGLHERFFGEIGEEAADESSPHPKNAPPDIERIASIAAKYGIEIPPPPETRRGGD